MFVVVNYFKRNIRLFSDVFKNLAEQGEYLLVGKRTINQREIKVFRKTVILKIEFFVNRAALEDANFCHKFVFGDAF